MTNEVRLQHLLAVEDLAALALGAQQVRSRMCGLRVRSHGRLEVRLMGATCNDYVIINISFDITRCVQLHLDIGNSKFDRIHQLKNLFELRYLCIKKDEKVHWRKSMRNRVMRDKPNCEAPGENLGVLAVPETPKDGGPGG